MFSQRIFANRRLVLQLKRFLSKSTLISNETVSKKSHAVKLGKYLESQPHLKQIKKDIPEKYMKLKYGNQPESIYLIDEEIAKSVARKIVEIIKEETPETVVCESNVGLGLLTRNLLENGLDKLRLYEICPVFRESLKEVLKQYHDRVQLFTKDLFHLERLNFMDRQDKGDRIDLLLKNILYKKWEDQPGLTIIGPMTSTKLIYFLIRSLALQTKISNFGRIQIFALMQSHDYLMLSAGPHLNLHTYQRRSVLFNLFFDYKLIEKFPRKSFLPWHNKKITIKSKYHVREDPDNMYFVQMVFKKKLPVDVKQLLQLYHFVFQFFGKGTNKVIPTLEKWFPDCGPYIIVPKRQEMTNKINIYTRFGDLTPLEILHVFLEISKMPNFENSPFFEMIENELVKFETKPTDEDDTEYNQDIIEEVEKHIT